MYLSGSEREGCWWSWKEKKDKSSWTVRRRELFFYCTVCFFIIMLFWWWIKTIHHNRRRFHQISLSTTSQHWVLDQNRAQRLLPVATKAESNQWHPGCWPSLKKTAPHVQPLRYRDRCVCVHYVAKACIACLCAWPSLVCAYITILLFVSMWIAVLYVFPTDVWQISS